MMAKKDNWDKVDIVSKIVHTIIVGGVVTIAATYLNNRFSEQQLAAQKEQQTIQQEVLRAQIASQNEEHSILRKKSEAELTSTLLPIIMSDSGNERRMALAILSSLAPDSSRIVSNELLNQLGSQTTSNSNTGNDTVFLKHIQMTSKQNSVKESALEHLANAKRYASVELYGPAVQEYERSYEILDKKQKNLVSQDDLLKVRSEFNNGKYLESAQLWRDIFHKLVDGFE